MWMWMWGDWWWWCKKGRWWAGEGGEGCSNQQGSTVDSTVRLRYMLRVICVPSRPLAGCWATRAAFVLRWRRWRSCVRRWR